MSSIDDILKNLMAKSPLVAGALKSGNFVRSFPAMRHISYAFPETVLEPGTEDTVKVDLRGVFKMSKLVVFATMREVRGHFRIKYSRLPLLNRDEVLCSYSTLRRWRRGRKRRFLPGKTVVEYCGRDDANRIVRSFKREYQPASVLYIPTDASSYINVQQILCGREPTLAGAVPAVFLSANSLGNCIPAPSTDVSVSLSLKNTGDVSVRVLASVMGIGEWSEERA